MKNIFETKKYASSLKKADELLSKMSLAEKIGQLSQFGTSIYSDDEKLFEDHFQEGKVGSYLTIKGAEKTNGIQKTLLSATRLPIPAIFADDVIHGYRTTFPTPIAQSCSWNPEITKKCSALSAKEAYRAGIKWVFSPMVDIARDPRWGRIMEGYGEDTYLCSRFSEAAVIGYQGEGEEALGKDKVLACMKHFAAYGACIGGRDYNSADMSISTLHDVYLPPFKAGLDAGAATVMSAFEDLNGVPATANKYLLTDVLREQFGFNGFVVSDAGAVTELIPHGYATDPVDAACKAYNAGCDMLMAGDLYNDTFPALLNEGKITIEQINNSVRSILALKYFCGLMDEPYVDPDGEDCFFCEEHMQASRCAASECAVLLENDGILPLSKDIKRIALIGPLAQDDNTAKGDFLGNWTCLPDALHTVTIPEGLKKALGDGVEFSFAKGCSNSNERDEGSIEDAVKTASECDAVIAVIGESAGDTGEASSHASLRLPGKQTELISALAETGKPLIVLVSSGRPVILTDIKDKASALMLIWQLGSSTGDAVADLLTGKVTPSGHLSTSFPVSEGQIPVYYNHNNTGRPAYDRWVFESKYRDCQIAPLYPFGYGKSYTEFEYSDIKLSSDQLKLGEKLHVTLNVKNIGKHDGATVVQLYIRDLIGSTVRPVKELKGFEKIYLKKGETKTAELIIDTAQLGFHDSQAKYIVESGDFKLWVAENSADDSREFSFKII